MVRRMEEERPKINRRQQTSVHTCSKHEFPSDANEVVSSNDSPSRHSSSCGPKAAATCSCCYRSFSLQLPTLLPSPAPAKPTTLRLKIELLGTSIGSSGEAPVEMPEMEGRRAKDLGLSL